ncbi:HD domain-containing protein [Spirulina major CS-329]|uniref:HD domain-containing protein n=1 Tax=Spirulina TaxID=1154 RepID=UPI00232C9DFE|nr:MULTISPECIES: HD domain-containing protein [Spirulina]MDB9495587.1 HD domain-containing protein [Spirulina subsalsa CS-330]MDB9503938.1 HD domain-containing protein [Spirulina major CS-329]
MISLLPVGLEPRLMAQVRFIVEIDRLKTVLRQTKLADGSRRENSAEHSWHLALMAIALADYAPLGVDLHRAIALLLVHDLVEIDAGDTFCYDVAGNADKAEREQRAADRIFGLLPSDQGQDYRELWDEFEAGETVTAQFAIALDRLQPFLLNLANHGGTWREHGIDEARIRDRMAPVARVSPELGGMVEAAIAQCRAAGCIP